MNDITTMTVEQLKVIVYDAIKLLNQAQNTINTVEQELQKRAKLPEEPNKE